MCMLETRRHVRFNAIEHFRITKMYVKSINDTKGLIANRSKVQHL